MAKLEVQDIEMEFPGVKALSGVSLAFEPGEVHGVVGENGAGKSTLMKILGGIQRETAGRVLLDGRPVAFTGVRDALRHGIAMIHQELNLVDELTVAENVFLGRELSRGGLLDRARMIEEASNALQQVHASFPATEQVGRLSIAGKQLVEIARALAIDASILIMDEPTAVLSEPEARSLFELIAGLKARGTTVIYISHRLDECCGICDRISVLRDGRLIGKVDARSVTSVEIAAMMVGRSFTDFYPPKLPEPEGDPVLEVTTVDGARFGVCPGEILGLAGLVGAGRTELAEALIGARKGEIGALVVSGVAQRPRSPKDAIRCGVAYVSEDRKRLGLHLSLNVRQNVTLANLRAYGAFLLDRQAEQRAAGAWQQDLDIRAPSLETPVLNLSGGNQQKIAIAKWLEVQPKVLILDEPTRGVDVGAKREMYALIQRFARAGMACVLISSELPEIISLCHRALVMRDGRIVGELAGPNLTEERVMHLAAGVMAA